MTALTVQQRRALRYATTKMEGDREVRIAKPTNHLAHVTRQVPPPPTPLDRVARVAEWVCNNGWWLCGCLAFAGWLLNARAAGGMP